MTQQIRYCTTTDGVRIAYSVTGSGPPLVRVLGFFTHLEFEQTGPILQPWLTYLSHDHQFIRYDGRGCGLSDRTSLDFSLAAKLRDLEAVITALGLSQIDLIGTSEGAATAVAYTATHPERVRHLVLYGGSLGADLSPEVREEDRALRTIVRLGWGRDTPAYRQFFTSLLFPDADAAFFQWFNELEHRAATPEAAEAHFVANDDIDVRPLLGRITTPTLVVHRRGDLASAFERGREAAASIPGARFLPVEGKNHLPMPGEPELDQILGAIRDFVAAAPPMLDGVHSGVSVQEGHQPGGAETVLPALSTDGLSPRELEVLRLVAAGKSNPEIAATLVISLYTVYRHLNHILSKTGCSNRVEAATYAHKRGIGG